MQIRLDDLDKLDIYQLMTHTILPRPVAWVLSKHANGKHNLAPFSYFNAVCSEPPLISISIGKKKDGSRKDSWENIAMRDDFIVHIAQANQAEAVNASAASMDAGVSEIEANGLKTVKVDGWPLPRLADAPVAMWCKRYQIIEIGHGPQALIIGKIIAIHLDTAVYHPDDEPDEALPNTKLLNPLARLGGMAYCKLGEIFEVERP